MLIKPHKPPEIIAGSEKGSDIDPWADLDKDEDQIEENQLSYMSAVSMCPSFTQIVFALV